MPDAGNSLEVANDAGEGVIAPYRVIASHPWSRFVIHRHVKLKYKGRDAG
jgi:hypothetical protein